MLDADKKTRGLKLFLTDLSEYLEFLLTDHEVKVIVHQLGNSGGLDIGDCHIPYNKIIYASFYDLN